MSTQDNKALSRQAIEEAWNKGNLSIIDQVYAPDFLGHDPGSPIGELRGREGARQYVSAYRTAFPDAHITIEDQIAEGDKVVTRFTARGIQRGALPGIPPTGKQAMVTGITIERFAGGKIVENWVNIDTLSMMQQLGVIPQMARSGA